MSTPPRDEEPGFEADVDELPEDNQASPDTLEDDPLPGGETPQLDEAQEQAAEERKEGGYQ